LVTINGKEITMVEAEWALGWLEDLWRALKYLDGILGGKEDGKG
jgi:hypothetical protein